MEMLVFLETDVPLTKAQRDEIKIVAEEQLGAGYKVVVLSSGLKAKVVPAAKVVPPWA